VDTQVDAAQLIQLLVSIIGWLSALCILLLGGTCGFFIAWQRRQDAALGKQQKELTSYRETAEYLKRIGEHNIPDAWKEADKSKDLLITTLTTMIMGFCGQNSCSNKGKDAPDS
jgi:hypothetical protein